MSKVYKLLIIEDEPALREVLIYTLQDNFELKILEASSGNEAIDIFDREEDIQLILSDYKMDDGNGGDVFLHVQEKGFKGMFNLISAYAIDNLPEFENVEAFEGNFNYFSKPWKDEDLVFMIQKHINYLELRSSRSSKSGLK